MRVRGTVVKALASCADAQSTLCCGFETLQGYACLMNTNKDVQLFENSCPQVLHSNRKISTLNLVLLID